MSTFDHEKLIVYQRALKFQQDVTILFQEVCSYKILKDQAFRACTSIVLNIAEGVAKFSRKDRRNFFVIARASVYEVAASLDILFLQCPGRSKEIDLRKREGMEIVKMLSKMISLLSSD